MPKVTNIIALWERGGSLSEWVAPNRYRLYKNMKNKYFISCYIYNITAFVSLFLALILQGRLARMVLISWEKAATENMKLSSSKAGEEQRETFRSKRSNKYKKRKKQMKRSVEDFKKVSWRLPHHHDLSKKLKHNNGVFDSDYEHARTHPPSHN